MRPGASGHRPATRTRDPDRATREGMDPGKVPDETSGRTPNRTPGKTSDRAPDPDEVTDPDKAAVLGWIEELARAGLARSRVSQGGEIELRLVTGEVFRLARNAVVRIS